MVPLEEKEGYDRKFAAAANIASAPTGLIIPPSGILIIYAVLSGCSVVGMIMRRIHTRIHGVLPVCWWPLSLRKWYPTTKAVPARIHTYIY
ncbi:MAG: TRAP transporter large permease subunit [Enterocloster sp.]|uniref:TRAP transporter large permease subunit n=1 Tax=Enterocloster sp. TaxID=2719315 RepID=UPI00399B4396